MTWRMASKYCIDDKTRRCFHQDYKDLISHMAMDIQADGSFTWKTDDRGLPYIFKLCRPCIIDHHNKFH